MKKIDKNGFTIVELVIVVAVIAIAAAVLIPTFTEVVSAAQRSKDMILMRSIHSVLEAERAAGSKILLQEDAKKILNENGIENIEVEYSNNAIYWDAENGYFILYTYHNDGAVLCPDKYVGGSLSDSWELVSSGDRDVSEEVESTAEVTAEEVEKVELKAELSSSSIVSSAAVEGSIALNGSYRTCLSVPATHVLTYCRVKMGGVYITESAVSKVGGKMYIDIEQVTGEVEISAYAVENAVASSLALGGKFIYGDISNGINQPQTGDGPGYVDDACLSTGSNTSGICATNPKEYIKGFTSTGWMEIPWGDSNEIEIYIFIKDEDLQPATNGYYRYWLYENITVSTKTNVINKSKAVEQIRSNYMKITLNKNNYSTCKYFRVSVKGKGENLIISFNEPIFP